MKEKYQKGEISELRQGDLVWFDPNPVIGREQGEYRPHLIISKEETNRANVATVLPITRTERKLPFRFPLELAKSKSWVVIDQPKTFDFKAREYELDNDEFLSQEELGKILGIFKVIFF